MNYKVFGLQITLKYFFLKLKTDILKYKFAAMSAMMKTNYAILANRALCKILPNILISEIISYLDIEQAEVRYTIYKKLYYNLGAELYTITYYTDRTSQQKNIRIAKYNNKYYILMRDMVECRTFHKTVDVALYTYNNNNNNKCVYLEGFGRCKYFIECSDNTIPVNKFSLSVIQIVKNLKNYPCTNISNSRKCITLTPESLCELASKKWG